MSARKVGLVKIISPNSAIRFPASASAVSHRSPCKPEKILSACKANATRNLEKLVAGNVTIVHGLAGGSKRYSWTDEDVVKAIAYVEYDQGEPLP